MMMLMLFNMLPFGSKEGTCYTSDLHPVSRYRHLVMESRNLASKLFVVQYFYIDYSCRHVVSLLLTGIHPW